ncbi:MAG: TIGR00269 family protein [Candidatus Heimdallarchaeota archaeon]|nr:TIGR00269 family protein [Candidatus Heimdallarchaeota archaeon]
MRTRCCENPPYTLDSRSRKRYCKTHFVELFEKRVRKTITQYKMFSPNDHIGLGLSGGKDSMVLIHILHKLLIQFPKSKITAISVDEGIKGYREDSIALAKHITMKYDIPHEIISFNETFGENLDQIVKKSIIKDRSFSPCAICGILRRRALNIRARQLGVTKIATAHNLDDEAQTIIMNLLRGDTLKFIRLTRAPIEKYKGMPPRVRPFVRVSEPEIVLYARAEELKYHSYPCPYAESAMRNDIRDFLSLMELKRPSTLINIINAHDSISKYFPQSNRLNPPHYCLNCGEISTHEVCPVCQLMKKLDLT